MGSTDIDICLQVNGSIWKYQPSSDQSWNGVLATHRPASCIGASNSPMPPHTGVTERARGDCQSLEYDPVTSETGTMSRTGACHEKGKIQTQSPMYKQGEFFWRIRHLASNNLFKSL